MRLLNVILSAAYQVLSIPRQHCPPDQSIETESECKQAADQVGIPYHNRDNWGDALPKCFAYKGGVYFNTPATGGTLAFTGLFAEDNAVCRVKGSGEPLY